MLEERAQSASPFRKPAAGEPTPGKNAHFVRPELVCNVRFTEWTDAGGIRQPSFLGLAPDVDPRECIYDGPGAESPSLADAVNGDGPDQSGGADVKASKGRSKVAPPQPAPKATVTNPEKVFWPKDGYTKGDLVAVLSCDFEMDAAVSEGSAGDADTVSGRHRRQNVLSKGCARIRAVVDSHREGLLRGLAARDFLFHPRQRGSACLRGEPRSRHDSHLVVAHPPSRTPRLAPVRHRSQGHHDRGMRSKLPAR